MVFSRRSRERHALYIFSINVKALPLFQPELALRSWKDLTVMIIRFAIQRETGTNATTKSIVLLVSVSKVIHRTHIAMRLFGTCTY